MDLSDSHFYTGQPIWVIEPDGRERPAEFVGRGEEPRPAPATALIIFLDVPSAAVVELERLRPREGMPRGGGRPGQAGAAAAERAARARARGQAAGRRAAELRGDAPRSEDPGRRAVERAFTAADDAQAAEADAAVALDRAAQAYELAARGYDLAAEAADRAGGPAAEHRSAARDARAAARRAREAASAARQRVHGLPIKPRVAAAPLGRGGPGRSARR